MAIYENFKKIIGEGKVDNLKDFFGNCRFRIKKRQVYILLLGDILRMKLSHSEAIEKDFSKSMWTAYWQYKI